jgi:hypothetical protein
MASRRIGHIAYFGSYGFAESERHWDLFRLSLFFPDPSEPPVEIELVALEDHCLDVFCGSR